MLFNKEKTILYACPPANEGNKGVIVVPDTVITIADKAFGGCTKVKEIILPPSLKEIGEKAFADCKALKKLVLPDGIETIGKEAFLRCGKLTNAGLKGSTKKGYAYEFPWEEEIIENAFSIATAAKRVRALFLGAEDLTADLQCKRTKEGREIEYARTRLVMAARAAGVEVYDTPFTDVNDDEGIEVDALHAKSLGFSGKASISPRHVTVINRVFSPTLEEIDYAYEVMEAIQLAKKQGKGAIALRGKMIDAPIVMRAQRTIAAAEALGLGREEKV